MPQFDHSLFPIGREVGQRIDPIGNGTSAELHVVVGKGAGLVAEDELDGSEVAVHVTRSGGSRAVAVRVVHQQVVVNQPRYTSIEVVTIRMVKSY